MAAIIFDDDSVEMRVLRRALELHKAQLSAHQEMLHDYRVADETVSVISQELRAIDRIIEEMR